MDNRFELYKIDQNGDELIRLTKNQGSNEDPTFSPDGEFIVYSSLLVKDKNNIDQNIYIINKEGEIIRKLTQRNGNCLTPRWSNFL